MGVIGPFGHRAGMARRRSLSSRNEKVPEVALPWHRPLRLRERAVTVRAMPPTPPDRPNTARLLLPDPHATTRLAGWLAPQLRAGDTVLLRGGLGAGKSHFARAAIQRLMAAAGPAEDVPSPTYTLVQTYRIGGVEVLHADLYRLTAVGGADEARELGLEDALEQMICLIEWPDRLDGFWPPVALDLALDVTGAGRIATLTGGARWAGILADLAARDMAGEAAGIAT